MLHSWMGTSSLLFFFIKSFLGVIISWGVIHSRIESGWSGWWRPMNEDVVTRDGVNNFGISDKEPKGCAHTLSLSLLYIISLLVSFLFRLAIMEPLAIQPLKLSIWLDVRAACVVASLSSYSNIPKLHNNCFGIWEREREREKMFYFSKRKSNKKKILQLYIFIDSFWIGVACSIIPPFTWPHLSSIPYSISPSTFLSLFISLHIELNITDNETWLWPSFFFRTMMKPNWISEIRLFCEYNSVFFTWF